MLTKARLAAAKGASAEATAAAEAIDHESFASVGSRRAAPPTKRQRGNDASATSKITPSLGLSNLRISLSKLKAKTRAIEHASKSLSACGCPSA